MPKQFGATSLRSWLYGHSLFQSRHDIRRRYAVLMHNRIHLLILELSLRGKEAAGKYDSQEENDLGADRTWQYSNCTLGLILSTDGKGIVMRQEALREVTRKAAETKHHKLEKRLSRGEKANRKRMSTVASVYDVERHVRSAESIMKLEEAKVEQASPPRAREKRVWASVERDQSQNWLGPRFVVLFGP